MVPVLHKAGGDPAEYDFNTLGNHIQGSAAAAVRLVEYADEQHCHGLGSLG